MENSDIVSRNKKSSVPFEGYKQFRNRYARATEKIMEVYGLTDSECFRRISKSSENWQKFKFLSKILFILLYSKSTAGLRNLNQLSAQIMAYSRRWDSLRMKTCPTLKALHMRFLPEFKLHARSTDEFK